MSFSRPVMKFFCGSSNMDLGNKMASYMDIKLGEMDLSKFSDGEVNIRIAETVRGHDVYLMQSTCKPVNDNLMELLIMIDAFKRASASSISVIIPYFGYARQDRKAKGRDPISAKLVANLLTEAGADRVITTDLHAEQIQGFFDIPLDNLQAFPVFIDYFKKMHEFNPEEYIVVSPDVGGVKRARRLAEKLKLSLAILDKRRPMDNVAEIVNVVGDVKGKNAIMFDDIIDTARSLVGAADALKSKGAKDVIACATHGILSGGAIERLQDSVIKEILITNTIPHDDLPDKFKILDLSELLGEAVLRVRKNLSVSILFN
ncbi:MAG TPA: ribose-phosphate pyrophosphokinase [Thermotogota bacterium]|nr:ribose-phosphate pyrophosphokinase [Thermotogota bacterium]HPJ88694.1 ribose-phosphate pyrophosphokinase [Thermotogota bacterium]HPR95957.1 ribose-phosphate pyrophosphokinase [Thermotogota bacterium]